jgi:hypothetical protein
MRVVVAFILLLALALGTPTRAQSYECTTFTPCFYYLPIIGTEPAPMSARTLQQADFLPGYAVDENREIANAEAAESYVDPAAALAAFAAQGRETSWYVRYSSSLYPTSHAIGISDQVVRYTTAAGADAGMEYLLADMLAQHPDYHTSVYGSYGDRTIAKVRSFTDGGIDYVKYHVLIRKERYLAIVQIIGRKGALKLLEADDFGRKAADRLVLP